MRKRISIPVVFLLLLALIMPGAVTAAPLAPAAPQAALLAAPTVDLVHPAQPLGNLGSGAPNVIDVNVAAPGATLRTAEYQTVFPAASLIGLEFFDQTPILPVPAPRAGAGANADDFVVPVGLVPADSVVAFVIFGTVTAVDTGSGEWQIGEPPIFVYESAATEVRAPAVVDREVRIVATRTLGPGPIVAEVIVDRGEGLPAAPPIRETAFLFNGTVESEQVGTSAPGISMGGRTWTVRGASPDGGVTPGVAATFAMDAPNFPAVPDPGIGVGSVVTAEFIVAPPVAAIASEVALEIFAQVPNIIPATRHLNPRKDTEEMPPGLPAGTWRGLVIAGRVSAVNTTTGEWQIGTPPVYAYEAGDGSTVFQGVPVVGDEVRIVANRTLASGPIVAEKITLRGADAPAGPAFVERFFLFNGTVEVEGLDTWTVRGPSPDGGITPGLAVDFIINDPDFPAGIDPGIGLPPNDPVVTVEFMHSGPPAPSPTLWARLALDPATGLQKAILNPPAVTGDRPGFLFVRGTDSLGQITVGSFAANLRAVPLAVPAAPAGLFGARTGNEVTLTWTDASLDEASFRVERASNDTFTLGRQTFIVAADSTTFMNTAPAVGAIFYRVIAVSGAGDSLPSNSVSPVAPNAPVIASPRNGALLDTLTPTLSWLEVVATEPTVYDLEITTAADVRFASPLIQQIGIAGLSFDVPLADRLPAGELIRWRVRATNIFGGSAWTTVTFRTPMGPPAPRPLAPRGIVPNLLPTLEWSAVTGAIGYDVQVSSSRLFAAPLAAEGTGLLTTTFDVPALALQGSTMYFWRVRVETGLGLSRWSAPGIFRTPFGPRVPPIPVAPRGIVNTLTPTLEWRILRDEATTFDVQLSTSVRFLDGTVLMDVTGIPAPVFVPGVTATLDVPAATLNTGTIYYWRVRGVNEFGGSVWRLGIFRTAVTIP